jgi:hypothetical protein
MTKEMLARRKFTIERLTESKLNRLSFGPRDERSSLLLDVIGVEFPM